MRKSRLLTLVFAFTLVAAFPAGATPVAPTCSPPGTWATRTAAPSPIVRAWGAFFPSDGDFYLLGGRSSDAAGSNFTQVNIYDPVVDSWSMSTATFSDGQVNNMVGGVLDFGGTPYIVVVGGSAAGGTTSSSDVRQYDPVADVMTTLTTDPWPGNTDGATLPGGAAVLGNKLYVFGGFDIGIGMTSAIYRFDPAAAAGSRWTTMTATLPNPIGYIPTAASGSLIYLLGGSGFAGGTLTDTTESSSYDPVADVIALITTIPRATGETRAVTAPDGSIWVLGGGRIAPNPSNEVDVYDPVGNAWSLGPAFSTARRNFPAGIDPVVGTIWATGGYDTSGTTLLDINEQFNPCNIVSTLPTVAKSFTPSSVVVSTDSTLTITLGNPTAGAATLTASLVDSLPAGLVATAGSAATTCVGGAGASTTGTTVTLGAGAVIPAAGSCTLTATVQAAVVGSYVNTIAVGDLQTSIGNNDTAASATLTTTPALFVPCNGGTDEIFCDGFDPLLGGRLIETY
jgi:hypothetical protein